MITAFYFSSLYYGVEVWYHCHLSFHSKQKIRTAHYRGLKLIYGHRPRDELDFVSQRANLDEYADYAIAKMIASMVTSQSPGRFLNETMMTAYKTRWISGRYFFYDDSKRKIGRQRLKNRLVCVTKQMKFEWTNISKDSLRQNLKKCFFQYYKSQL